MQSNVVGASSPGHKSRLGSQNCVVPMDMDMGSTHRHCPALWGALGIKKFCKGAFGRKRLGNAGLEGLTNIFFTYSSHNLSLLTLS